MNNVFTNDNNLKLNINAIYRQHFNDYVIDVYIE
jgi:hypothetical protein